MDVYGNRYIELCLGSKEGETGEGAKPILFHTETSVVNDYAVQSVIVRSPHHLVMQRELATDPVKRKAMHDSYPGQWSGKRTGYQGLSFIITGWVELSHCVEV